MIFSKQKMPGYEGPGKLKGRTMGTVVRPRNRRKGNDLNPIRRSEITRHARYVGAPRRDDYDRWIIAWIWHNPDAKDQVYSVMFADKQMNRRLTDIATGNCRPWSDALSEADAIAIVDMASEMRPIWNPDKLAKHLGLTYQQRTILNITTIGACDFSKAARTRQRKQKNRTAKERKRRASGALARDEYEAKSLSKTQPWREMGMSRAIWYRRNKAKTRRETGSSAATFLSPKDRPVSPERGAGLSEGRFASKEGKKEANRLSQTALTVAVDVYGSLPVELRL